MLKITFAQLGRFKADAKTARGALVLAVPQLGKALPDWLAAIDRAGRGRIKQALAGSRFKGKKKQTLTILAPQGLHYEQLVLVGLGKGKELSGADYEQIGGMAAAALNRMGVRQAALALHAVRGSRVNDADAAVHLAIGAQLKSYRFDKYRTKLEADAKPTLRNLTVFTDGARAAQAAYAVEEKVLEGTCFVRDLVNEPANILNPVTFAAKCKELAKEGIDVQVLGEKEMKKMGCGALLGVGQGSVHESQMVIMQWNGGGRNDKPLAFVGKGVTFDTGGISIKPAQGMEEMKMDMGGAAAVVGLMKALAARKARVNAVGVIGLVENMPSGEAQRPGDIVKSLSGQTIEVLNTDAEGRLVLADCLWYTQDRFKPQFMVNLATLTGAILVALGETTGGLFSNNDTLATRLTQAGAEVGEKIWRLPLGPEYDRLLDSEIADMQNISNGRWAGSITAAQFLQRFVNKVPWAHLDIAGVATASKATDIGPKGGSGFGVRLLNELVRKWYEK